MRDLVGGQQDEHKNWPGVKIESVVEVKVEMEVTITHLDDT